MVRKVNGKRKKKRKGGRWGKKYKKTLRRNWKKKADRNMLTERLYRGK